MTLNNSIIFLHKHIRLIIIGLTIFVILGALIFGTAANQKKVGATTTNEKYFKCVDIDTDDTLWSIAGENMTEEYASIDDYITEVKSINNLTGDKIYSGATLVVPYYAPYK